MPDEQLPMMTALGHLTILTAPAAGASAMTVAKAKENLQMKQDAFKNVFNDLMAANPEFDSSKVATTANSLVRGLKRKLQQL